MKPYDMAPRVATAPVIISGNTNDPVMPFNTRRKSGLPTLAKFEARADAD